MVQESMAIHDSCIFLHFQCQRRELRSYDMKKYFFDGYGIFEALMYIVFIVIVPYVSIILQFYSNDKTMYLSYFVAGFAMTYDYLVLFNRNVGKCLWWEFIAAVVCFISVIVASVVKLSNILATSSTPANAVTYGFNDFLVVSLLCIMVIVNVLEFCRSAKHDYNTRFPKHPSTLTYGAQNI